MVRNVAGGLFRAVRHRRRLVVGGATTLWAVGVFLVSTWQQPTLPSWGSSSWWAPSAHVLMYLVLAALLAWMVVPTGKRWRRLAFSLAAVFIVTTLYGASLEVYQGATGRDRSWQDGMFNAIGASVGTVGAYLGVAARPARVGPSGRS